MHQRIARAHTHRLEPGMLDTKAGFPCVIDQKSSKLIPAYTCAVVAPGIGATIRLDLP